MHFARWLFNVLAIEQLLSIKPVNLMLRMVLRPVSNYLPQMTYLRLPVAGKFSFGLPDGNRLVMEARGGNSITRGLYWKGIASFEYETARIFYALAKKANLVVDIGANIGYYTLLAAAANQEAQVFAFEPAPAIYRELKRNIELNGHHNISPVAAAVTNFDGNSVLYIPKPDKIPGATPLEASTVSDHLETGRIGEIVKVPAITLDSFARQHALKKVDLIKIDTEGTEHWVLEGAKDVISRDAPVIICEVLPGKTEKPLQAYLSEHGYQFYWITPNGLIPHRRIYGHQDCDSRNYLFCKGENIILKSSNAWPDAET